MHHHGGNKMGKWGATSYLIGNVLGSGIFITPALVLLHSSSMGIALIIWVVSALISAVGAYCYLELGTSIQRSGCDFAYFCYVKWRPVSFVFMLSCVVTYPLNLAVQAEAFGSYIIDTFAVAGGQGFCSPTVVPALRKLLGFSLVWLLMYLNFFSLRTVVSRFQMAAAMAKLVSASIIIGCGLYFLLFRGGADKLRTPFAAASQPSAGDLVTAFYGALYSYDGWDILNFGVEDVERIEHTMLFALLVGLSSVTVLFLLINLSFFTVLSIEEIKHSPAIAETMARAALGNFHYVMPVMVSILLIGSLNSSLFAASRQIYAASREGQLPSCLCCTNTRHDSPRAALLFHVILAMLLSNVGEIDELISIAQFAIGAQRCFVMAALLYIKIRGIPVDSRAIHAPIGVPVLYAAMCFVLVVVNVWRNPRTSFLGAIVPLLGLLVYAVVLSRRFSILRHSPKLRRVISVINNALTVCTQFTLDGVAYVNADDGGEDNDKID